MKTIGLIGGMSWESTAIYYQQLNQRIAAELGGLNSAKIHLTSVNFDEIATLQKQGDWHKAGEQLSDIAQKLESIGADYILICTNTMHKVAEHVQRSIGVPLLHIADATGEKIQENKLKKVGLLGTLFTMEQPFYRERLKENFNIDVVVPNESQRNSVHQIIFEELCMGICKETSKEIYLSIIRDMMKNGAEAVILGCTEIGILIKQSDIDLPLYDTTLLHVDMAINELLKNK